MHVCYRIHCQRCPESVVAKIPDCLFDNSYTIYDLDPETSYVIDVYTMNSITMNQLERANAESIQVTTGKLGEKTTKVAEENFFKNRSSFFSWEFLKFTSENFSNIELAFNLHPQLLHCTGKCVRFENFQFVVFNHWSQYMAVYLKKWSIMLELNTSSRLLTTVGNT